MYRRVSRASEHANQQIILLFLNRKFNHDTVADIFMEQLVTLYPAVSTLATIGIKAEQKVAEVKNPGVEVSYSVMAASINFGSRNISPVGMPSAASKLGEAKG